LQKVDNECCKGLLSDLDIAEKDKNFRQNGAENRNFKKTSAGFAPM